MTPPGGVEHLLAPAETVDRLGDKAAVPRPAGALDLSVAPAIACFGKDTAIGRREGPIAEQPPRGRRPPVREVDRSGARPFAPKQLRDRRDGHADLMHGWVAVLGVADWAEDLGKRHR